MTTPGPENIGIEARVVSQYEELPEELKAIYEEDIWDRRCYTALVVFRNGEVLWYATDGFEPEDACFYRDLAFIKTWVEEAYKLGYTDAKAAAPDLLEALKWAAKQFHHPSCRVAKGTSLNCTCFIAACEKAIAKAEGRNAEEE